MENEEKTGFRESLLYDYWIKNNFQKEVLTYTGEKIEILNPGELNSDEAGPDFRNARIKLGNIVYVGDVEIDSEYRDWKYHGHSRNKRFNKVILHSYFHDGTTHSDYVYTENGRKIPSIPFCRLVRNISNDLKTSYPKNRDRDETDHLVCKWVLNHPDPKIKLDFLYQLGMQKFKRKCERMIERIRELLYISENGLKEPFHKYEIPKEFFDRQFTYEEISNTEIWEQLLYESVFEALGYPQNKNPMLKLSQFANLNFFRKINNSPERILSFESALLNISGVLGSELDTMVADPYIRKIREQWESIRLGYDSKTLDEHEWHFFKMRPQNFPTIRLAGGARLIDSILNKDLIPVMIKKFTEIHTGSVLIQSVKNIFIIKAEGFWEKHYTLTKPARGDIKMFIGVNRAEEIILNVALPFMYVYFLLFNKTNLAKKTLSVFSEATLKLENRIVRDVAEGLKLENSYDRSVIYLGMLELFRNYCSRERCGECVIGENVFNEN